MSEIQWLAANMFEWRPPPECRLVLCDPPYGTGKVFKSFFAGVPDFDDTDKELPAKMLAMLLSWNLPLCFFCDPMFPFDNPLPRPERILFWKTSWISGFKSSATLPRQIDLILCYNTSSKGIIELNGKTLGALIDDDKLVSPVHKSYVKKRSGLSVEKGKGIGAVITAAFSNPGDLVVDACCGPSGSLARGAASLGRRVIAFDIEPAYIERAKDLMKGEEVEHG